MNVNIESPSALRRKLTIEVAPEEIKTELDRAYNELKRGVQLKGFRPGHAPRKLLERFFGDQVRTDVIQRLVKEYTGKALEEHSFKPLLAPEIVTEEADLTKLLKFSATFDVRPELEIKDYQGLKVQRPQIEVKDQEVEAALERMRERMAALKKIEGRTVAAKGDFVLAQIQGYVDGKAVKELDLGERMVELDPARLAHGLDEVLAGAEAGQPVAQNKSYPADYAEKDLAGKTVEWRATVKELFEKRLPALDDEFARDQGEFESLDALKAQVRKSLEEQARNEAAGRARQALLDLVIERNPVEVPESLVARESRALENDMHRAFEAAGLSHEQAGERVTQSAEEIRTRAAKRATAELVVDAIADQEKVEVGDDEVAERIAQMVTQSGRERERVAKFYREEENREVLRRSMRRDKTMELMLSRAQVEDAPADQAPASL